MDMMRPQSVALPPNMPAGLTADNSADPTIVQLDWIDSSIADTQTLVQVSGTATGPWITLQTIEAPLDLVPNYTGPESYSDVTGGILEAQWNFYRVVAQNTIGYGGQFMDLTAESATQPVQVPAAPIAGVAPTSLAFGSLEVGTSLTLDVTLSNSGRAALNISSITLPAGYTQTNDCGGALAAATDAATPAECTISVTFAPTAVATSTGNLVIATDDPLNPSLTVALSGTGTALLAPTNLSGSAVRIGRTQTETVALTFIDNSLAETGFTLQRRTVNNAGQCNATTSFAGAVSQSVGVNPGTGQVSVTQTPIPRSAYCYRVQAVSSTYPAANSAWSNVLYVARP
jgi:hypothetical protein